MRPPAARGEGARRVRRGARPRLFALGVVALGVAADLGLGRAFDELAVFVAAGGSLGEGGGGAGQQADGGKRKHELFHW